jgi:hypothetical protein
MASDVFILVTGQTAIRFSFCKLLENQVVWIHRGGISCLAGQRERGSFYTRDCKA